MEVSTQLIGRESLFGRLCTREALEEGFRQVKKNRGTHGGDEVSITDFADRLEEELAQLQKDLRSWRYKPAPIRRVLIPKPGSKEKRKLGIPTVRDRVVQTALKQLLEPILDPGFSNSSHGFRPNRGPQTAIERARQLVSSGKDWVVDIDLAQFFDRVNHDRLIARLSQRIEDKKILRLIGLILRSGIMEEGIVKMSPEGTPQGSPLSPLLSNLVLDELDKELERRNLSFCRYADDCNIFVKSKLAAERAMQNLTKFIESKLKLKVNREKSHVGKSQTVKFLGITIIGKKVCISKVSMGRAMSKLKELTRRDNRTMEEVISGFNRWYRGWFNYYRIGQYPGQLRQLEQHFRRRIRSRVVGQQKRRRHLARHLIKRGIGSQFAATTAYSNNGRWALSRSKALHISYPNKWFTEQGMLSFSDLKLKHWCGINRFVKLT